MKHLKLTKGILAIAIIALVFTSCKENKKDQDDNDGTHVEMKNEDHSKMKHNNELAENSSTTKIIDAYIQIKNGLVADSKDNTAKGATAMLTAFSKFDMTKLSNEAHKSYMEIYESAKEQAEHIVKSPIAHQREHFETLSADVGDLIELLGTEKTLYKDFCPMANKNKGAYWLSEIKEIRNPYFGARMLKCGAVKDQIN